MNRLNTGQTSPYPIKLSELRENHSILARYPMLPTKSNDAVIDLNRSGKAEVVQIDQDRVTLTEPVLDLDLQVLRDFSDLNEFGSVYQEQALDYQLYYEADWYPREERMRLRRTKGKLRDLANRMSPLTPPVTGWAIDVGEKAGDRPYFYILADKNP